MKSNDVFGLQKVWFQRNKENLAQNHNINYQNQEKTEIDKFINQLSERIEMMESILVVDRVESNYAICENRKTGEIMHIELNKLPIDVKEGSVLRFKDGNYVLDSVEQKEIESRIKEKMDKLWNN